MTAPATLYAFNDYSVDALWHVVDDIVMGGRSEGHFAVTEEKYGRFYGKVSLENNGGFSSVRRAFSPPLDVQAYRRMFVRLKGDGSTYQLRIKADPGQRHNYVHEFTTTGEWEIIEIDFADLYPQYRGDRLDQPNFDGSRIAELGFLIGNGRAQAFELLLDRFEAV